MIFLGDEELRKLTKKQLIAEIKYLESKFIHYMEEE